MVPPVLYLKTAVILSRFDQFIQCREPGILADKLLAKPLQRCYSVSDEKKRGICVFSNRDLKKLLVPLVVEQILTALMGTMDTMMVARVSRASGWVRCVTRMWPAS